MALSGSAEMLFFSGKVFAPNESLGVGLAARIALIAS
jgi:hypothetical protein